MIAKQGWTWLVNARKWHYFVDHQSLCGRWGLFVVGDLEDENHESSENCKTCLKKLRKLHPEKFEGSDDLSDL